MTILFTNNAAATLASSITSTATSLTVTTGQGALFPTITGSNIFYATLTDAATGNTIEIVKVTARSSDTFTIVRGQDNTSGHAYSAGDKVELRLPAIVLQDFPQLDVANTFTGANAYGTPASITLTNATGLPVSTGISGLGTGVATALGAGVSGSGNIALVTSPTITTGVFTGAKETQSAISASAIDLTLGNYFTKTISTTTTFTISNTASSGTVNSFILDLTNGGSATVNWWSGVKWAGGTAPTLTSSGRDVLGFFTEDGGTTWNGFVLGKAMA